jgi:hypothetical protein
MDGASSSSPAVMTVTVAPSPAVVGDKREPILFMGVGHSGGIQEQMFCNFFLVALLAPFLCVVGILIAPLCIILGVHCGKMAAESWRLNLTKSAVHYLHIGMCNYQNRMWHIPLNRIKDISALEDAHTILIKMDPKDLYQYVDKPFNKEFDCIVIKHCKNARDFAREVKRQIVANNDLESV